MEAARGRRSISRPRGRHGTRSKLLVVLTLILVIASLYVLDVSDFFLSVVTSRIAVSIRTHGVEGGLREVVGEGTEGRVIGANPLVLLKVRGPVSIRRVQNDTSRAELVFNLDAEDLQDIVEDYRRGFATVRPVYPTGTQFILSNPSICSGSAHIDWIIYVHSAVGNSERRQLLRDTWANRKLFKTFESRVIFLIGRAAFVEEQTELNEEFKRHGDIVQGDFVDSYKNMTLKAVMGLKWISTYCPQAHYGVKADDDTFMNIFAMSQEMTSRATSAAHHNTSIVLCPLWSNMPILRERKSCMKWCVRNRDFPGLNHFPQYCAGIGYAISGSLIGSLYRAAETTPFFWIDDVYITGLLVKKLSEKVEFINLMNRFTMREELALEQYLNASAPITHYFVHTHNRVAFLSLWNQLLNRLDKTQLEMLSGPASQFKLPTDIR